MDRFSFINIYFYFLVWCHFSLSTNIESSHRKYDLKQPITMNNVYQITIDPLDSIYNISNVCLSM